jgi:hypothetical protein
MIQVNIPSTAFIISFDQDKMHRFSALAQWKPGPGSKILEPYIRASGQISFDARAESRRLLRLQVKDFIDWLKGQGVI